MNPTLIIDPEFRALIPPLSPEELAQLEENLVRDGCRDDLVAWQSDDGDVLLDGHNRYEICTRRGISFKVHYLTFDDRDAAADWIDSNQLGRRNLKPDDMSKIRGRIYNRTKKKEGAQPGNANRSKQLAQNEPRLNTAETLAKEYGVSVATIKRDGQFASAVEALKPVAPDLESRIMAGTAPTKVAIVKAAKVAKDDPEESKRILNAKRRQQRLQLKRRQRGARKEDGEHPTQELRPVTYAKQYAQMAIETLKRILPDDPKRIEAFKRVMAWIESQLQGFLLDWMESEKGKNHTLAERRRSLDRMANVETVEQPQVDNANVLPVEANQ
ncbi:MAG: hypothetical protein NTX50_24250 [Candidatus Sumerlaeota bacterium]|nr:hypothetical protein [Candidatus Sumerlaeota bacterium]